jgi:hypothetical protein
MLNTMALVAPLPMASELVAPLPSTEALMTKNSKLGTDILQLKKENALLKQENVDLKKKRKSEDAASSGPPTKKAKTPAQRKKLFVKGSNALNLESARTKIMNGWGGESFLVDVKETAFESSRV